MTARRTRTLSLTEGLMMATVSPLLLTGLALVAAWAIAVLLILAANGQ